MPSLDHSLTPVELEYNTSEFKPIRVWGLLRHGTTYPGKKMLYKYDNLTFIRDEILEKKGKLSLSNETMEAFEEWNSVGDMDYLNNIVDFFNF
jgi:hypothetical protein